MNGELVGTLEKHKNGAHTFQYDKNWITNAASRPLSLSLKLQLPTITSDAVINFFDNLLPDSPQVRDRKNNGAVNGLKQRHRRPL